VLQRQPGAEVPKYDIAIECVVKINALYELYYNNNNHKDEILNIMFNRFLDLEEKLIPPEMNNDINKIITRVSNKLILEQTGTTTLHEFMEQHRHLDNIRLIQIYDTFNIEFDDFYFTKFNTTLYQNTTGGRMTQTTPLTNQLSEKIKKTINLQNLINESNEIFNKILNGGKNWEDILKWSYNILERKKEPDKSLSYILGGEKYYQIDLNTHDIELMRMDPEDPSSMSWVEKVYQFNSNYLKQDKNYKINMLTIKAFNFTRNQRPKRAVVDGVNLLWNETPSENENHFSNTIYERWKGPNVFPWTNTSKVGWPDTKWTAPHINKHPAADSLNLTPEMKQMEFSSWEIIHTLLNSIKQTLTNIPKSIQQMVDSEVNNQLINDKIYKEFVFPILNKKIYINDFCICILVKYIKVVDIMLNSPRKTTDILKEEAEYLQTQLSRTEENIQPQPSQTPLDVEGPIQPDEQLHTKPEYNWDTMTFSPQTNPLQQAFDESS